MLSGPQNLYNGVYDTDESDAEAGASGSKKVASTPGGSGKGNDGSNRWMQCARVWFCFENERTVHVQKRGGHIGLQPVRQEEGWILVRALEGSPCAGEVLLVLMWGQSNILHYVQKQTEQMF